MVLCDYCVEEFEELPHQYAVLDKGAVIITLWTFCSFNCMKYWFGDADTEGITIKGRVVSERS